jgi:hypothetical protein
MNWSHEVWTTTMVVVVMTTMTMMMIERLKWTQLSH